MEQEERLYLTNRHPKIPVLYLIPKIHKNLSNPPGRPIISAMDSLLENTSRYIDSFLRPYVISLPSYIKDTGDFLRTIRDIYWEVDFKLMTLDVCSLYTCIDHSLGIESCEFFLKTRPLSYLQYTEMIVDMLRFCLQHNFFIFDNLFYRQTRGAAMGSCFSPSYANLLVGWWERQIADSIFGFDDHVVLWLRYIDDLFVIWNGSIYSAEQFVCKLNQNKFNLRFTSHIHATEVEFLDIKIQVSNHTLQTSLHKKIYCRQYFVACI